MKPFQNAVLACENWLTSCEEDLRSLGIKWETVPRMKELNGQASAIENNAIKIDSLGDVDTSQLSQSDMASTSLHDPAVLETTEASSDFMMGAESHNAEAEAEVVCVPFPRVTEMAAAAKTLPVEIPESRCQQYSHS